MAQLEQEAPQPPSWLPSLLSTTVRVWSDGMTVASIRPRSSWSAVTQPSTSAEAAEPSASALASFFSAAAATSTPVLSLND